MAEQIGKYEQVVAAVEASGEGFEIEHAFSQRSEGRKGVEINTSIYVAEMGLGREVRFKNKEVLAEEMETLGLSATRIENETIFSYSRPLEIIRIEIHLLGNPKKATQKFEEDVLSK